jgi:hypothetical protein
VVLCCLSQGVGGGYTPNTNTGLTVGLGPSWVLLGSSWRRAASCSLCSKSTGHGSASLLPLVLVRRAYLYVTCDEGSLALVGLGTCWPASMDDSSEVGGSMTGCRVGWPAGVPKSCALVPGSALWKPSLTAWVLEFSWGGRDWCGTCSSPVPEPDDVASASLLRAERVLDFSLSIATTKSKMGNAAPSAIPGKHGFMTWKRRWPNAGWRLKIGFTSLEFCLGARHIAPLPPPTPFLAVYSHRTRDNVRGDSPLLFQVSVWATDVKERL